jgi:hypothetical protein
VVVLFALLHAGDTRPRRLLTSLAWLAIIGYGAFYTAIGGWRILRDCA